MARRLFELHFFQTKIIARGERDYERSFVAHGLSHPRRPRGSKSGQNEVNRAEIVAPKVFSKSGKSTGKRVSPDHSQTALRMLASV